MNNIKAIETWYKGIKFRSRLEAKWAVFFDACDIKWEYELEGYEIDGEKYLPDFYLPELDTYVEVKGQRPGYEQEILKLQKFIVWGGPIKQIVILSDLPNSKMWGLPHFPAYHWHTRAVAAGWFFFYDEEGDVKGHISSAQYMGPYITRGCVNNKFSIEPVTDYYLTLQLRGYEDAWKKAYDESYFGGYTKEINPIVMDAYDKARSARFEHGENGAVI